VVFLTDKEYKAHPTIDSLNNEIVNEMSKNLEEYRPGLDYILLTGSPMASVLVGFLLWDVFGIHKLLKWNNLTKTYELVKFSVDRCNNIEGMQL
jgi:hypothetical protein